MEFEWDERKAAENLRKHGIAFEDAAAVFGDPFLIDEEDPYPNELRHRAIVKLTANSSLSFIPSAAV